MLLHAALYKRLRDGWVTKTRMKRGRGGAPP